MTTGAYTYALFFGGNMAERFESGDQALAYMARNADLLLDADAGLLVFDADGIAQIALVDGRKNALKTSPAPGPTNPLARNEGNEEER